MHLAVERARLNSSRGPIFHVHLPRPGIPHARSDPNVAALQHWKPLRLHTTIVSLGDARRVDEIV